MAKRVVLQEPLFEYTGTSPIFILGIERRSGTHFLQKLLACHSQCREFAIPEDFMLESSWMLEMFGRNIRALNSKWHWKRNYQDHFLKSIGSGLMTLIKAQNPGKRGILKTPSVKGIANFFKMFPEAPLLIIVRDGRAISESYVRTWGGTYDQIISRWSKGAAEIIKFKNKNKGKKFLILKYEDLVRDVEGEITKVLTFLELDPHSYDFKKALALPVYGSSTFKNKRCAWTFPKSKTKDFEPQNRFSHWKAGQHRKFNNLAGALSLKLGYDVKREFGREEFGR